MHNEGLVNNHIADAEDIARIIFAPSMLHNGQISPTAFCMDNLPGGQESYVSVWRLSLKTPTKYNVDFRPRIMGDSLEGYAKLNVGECRKVKFEDCSVDVHQHGRNLHHAGIEYINADKRIKGICRSTSFLMVTKMLATKATFVRI